MKIAFFDAKGYDIESFTEINNKFGFKIKFFETKLNVDSALLTKGFDVVCVFVNDFINEEVINILVKNGVKLITLRCAGFNNVDFESCKDRIKVVRVPEYSPHAVAEFTMGLMMELNRKIYKAYQRTREANFTLNGLLGFDFNTKTVGLVGTGKIAGILIKILNGFGAKVIAFDPSPKEDLLKTLDFTYVDIDTLYREADIISLHCPLNKHTQYLINSESIGKMKNGVMIINTGRGKLINTIDLINGLKSKKISSAGLDVYEEEADYFFEDRSSEILSDDTLARLLTFNNVIVTSHQAFFTKEALSNIADTTLNSVKQLQNGENLTNEIAYICIDDHCHTQDVYPPKN